MGRREFIEGLEVDPETAEGVRQIVASIQQHIWIAEKNGSPMAMEYAARKRQESQKWESRLSAFVATNVQ
jgi:hypothetical protein